MFNILLSLELSVLLDLRELKLKVLFDLSEWKSLSMGCINSYDVTDEFKTEKNSLNDYMFKFIFQKYKQNTATFRLNKTASGYSLQRKCQSKDCRSVWSLRIDLKQKSSQLDCAFMCNHTASEIKASREETS